jgi:hypothetical protein
MMGQVNVNYIGFQDAGADWACSCHALILIFD